MTVKTLVPLAAALALAGCNSKPEVDVKDAKPGEVARAVADAGGADTFVRPGKWQTTFKLKEMTMPGMPAQMAEQMKKTMSKVESSESCLTPEQVKKPKEDFFAGKQRNCTYDHFTMAGGTIDAEMTCKDGGANMNMTVKGTYSPDSYKATTTMALKGGGAQGMTMKASIDAKRVGDCAKS
jgi:hypothetical protein